MGATTGYPIVGLSSAIVGVYGLVKGEPRLPGLIAMGTGLALILGYHFSA